MHTSSRERAHAEKEVRLDFSQLSARPSICAAARVIYVHYVGTLYTALCMLARAHCNAASSGCVCVLEIPPRAARGGGGRRCYTKSGRLRRRFSAAV
jgi:hypothetical protein